MMEDAAHSADLLMECDEEEQEVWPQSSDSDEEEDEGLKTAASPLQEDKTVRIIPIPLSKCSPPIANNTEKSPAAPLGFMVNGQLVPLLPGGEGTELKLCSHPGGSASGFTTVQVPVTLTVHSLAGTHHISTTASLISSPSKTSSSPPGNGPQTTHTPIITGVVSGKAAQKVLSDHNVNFSTTKRLAAKSSSSSRSKSRPTAPHALLRKGELGPVSPPDCSVCMSHYKLIPELRGFICLCSPMITQSLKTLKRRNRCNRWRRDKSKISKTSRDPQVSNAVSKTLPAPAAPKVTSPPARTYRSSDEFLSDQFSSPLPSTNISSPQQGQAEHLPDLSHGKLVILVEDFYYGSASAPNSAKVLSQKCTGPYHCIHCPKTLRNNIKLMSHMQQHVSVMSQHKTDVDTLPLCPHCFRRFQSLFKLQCHLQAVHSQCESTVTCKICELDFGNEPSFLWHMKSTHKPGEMPYVCQVCDFRSSFYSDVWTHFQEAHADTKYLLCQYCLRVLRSNTCYQQHFARHQRKHVFGCDKCRLQFLYAKEREEHNVLHHRTHIRPPQLTGLKPGTKVTVRTYSVVGGSDEDGLKKPTASCKVVDVDPPPPTQDAPRRKPVESLALLLSSLSQDSAHRPSHRCVECLSWVRDFRTHFPSLVHCSLCKFITCCSTSYANHMINNHATCSKVPHYRTIFHSDLRLSLRLDCVLCKFSTSRGDIMANHLMERPEHDCAMLMQPESNKVKPGLTADSAAPPGGRGPGAFVPISLLPSGQAFTQLSVKPLISACPLSTPPAMTIRFRGPPLQPQQSLLSPLGVSELSAVLSSLCHGVSWACQQHHMSPEDIKLWTEQQERGIGGRKWYWRTDKMAQWLLIQREQQLMVREDVLLQTTRTALGRGSSLLDCYRWTVDFMLRHGLSVQPTTLIPNCSRKNKLPKSIREDSRTFIKSFCLQLQNKPFPPQFMGCMDEFSIFIALDDFANQNPAAFQLFASSEDKPVFDIVLSALSDGTFLPPLLFFTGDLSRVPDGFPDNILLEAQQEGFSDQERLQIWINKVWRPHVASSLSLLMVDVYRGHLGDQFRHGLSSISSDVAFIPSGCSCRLQPLNVCVAPVLRDFLQARWTQMVSQGGLDGLGLDQLAVTLACWLSEVSFTLNSKPDFLRRSFSSVCNLQHLDDRQEATDMIHALNKILIQPLETPVIKSEPLQLLIVMEREMEDKQKKEVKTEDTRTLVDSPVALHQVFDGDSDQETFHGFRNEDMDD